MTDWVNVKMFNMVHRNNLVYNTCWEDPRLDRVALELTPQDNVLVITSAGCNALDYALAGANHVYAVDMNPRQNALLELKKAGIQNLEFEDFFKMFGEGRLPNATKIYSDKLRSSLNGWTQEYWDRWIKFFDNVKRPFYFRGTSGAFARWINLYVDRVVKVRQYVNDILSADSVEDQRYIYDNHLRDRFWTRTVRFAMGRDTTLSMLGVPKAQRLQVERDYAGGIVQFVQDCVEAVFAKIPIIDNYFWRVYLTGKYTQECCPEYLKAENFQRLKDGEIERVTTHTNTVQGFLESGDEPISRFVLLDHMDWLSTKFFHLLESEWQAILDRAADNARFIWRSGGLRTDFVDRVNVNYNGQARLLGDLLGYNTVLADDLHQQDRVHTYGSFYISSVSA
ncbi:MAG: BtaA family protein [Planctomycetales bacterium]|nr:BtaA family protein [Planctomycetales bacterium]